MSNPLSRTRLSLTFILTLSPAACVTTTTTETPRPGVAVNGQQWSADESIDSTPVRPMTPTTPAPPVERTIKADPNPTRLHEIAGALLEYYALQTRLPARLEDLQPLADVGAPLNFVSPVSNRPFAYVPTGLRSPADPDRVLIVHDAVPDAAGGRWAILMQRPRGRQAPAMLVEFLTDRAFRAYAPAPATTTAAPR
jgi:hypothetical protein